jgi:glucose-1-phosphate cytidylyltransferase
MIYRSAIILCGGKGTRLGELGKKFPKTLVKIQNRPILWYILNSLEKNKFNHFILPVGYKGKQIQKFINNNTRFKKSKIDVVKTGINTSIAQRIFKIKGYIKSENFIILNGDAIFDANLNDIFKSHILKKKDISFISCEAEADFGTVGVINNRVINFERSLNFKSVNTNMNNFKAYVYSGMSIINRKILEENFKGCLNFEKDFYPKVIKKFKTDIHTLKGFWFAMDNVKQLQVLNKRKINKKIFNKIYNLLKKFK